MDFLRAIFAIVTVVGIALLLGWVKHKEHPELYTYLWVGSIIVLLIVRFCL